MLDWLLFLFRQKFQYFCLSNKNNANVVPKQQLNKGFCSFLKMGFYIEKWRRATIEIDNASDPSEIVLSEILAIESRYSDSDLEALIRNKGVAPTTPPAHSNTSFIGGTRT